EADPGPVRVHQRRRRAAGHPRSRAPAGQPGQRLQRVRGRRLAHGEEGGRERRADLRRGRLAGDPYYTEAERAALALAEAVTRLSDRADPVPDEIWDAAAHHYDERGLAALILMIATTNLFNRLNVSTRQQAGAWG